MDGFTESESEETTASDGDKSLFGLKVDGLVLDGVFIVCEKIIHSIGDVRKRGLVCRGIMFPEAVDGKCKNKKDRKRCEEMLYISSSDEEHDNDYGRQDKYGTEVRLEH